MKLKSNPEDFIVEEIPNINIVQNPSSYKVFLLEKKGVETFAFIDHFSKKHRIRSEDIGFAGLKDKHALTRQYITLPKKIDMTQCKEKDYSLTLAGYSNEPLKLGMLIGNRFTIIARDICKGEIDGILKKAKTIAQDGVPNYFDSQRFGSIKKREFIAKRLIQKNYEGAIKIYLTEFTPFEKKIVKDEKRLILSRWRRFDNLHITTKSLKNVIFAYKKRDDWLDAYDIIPQKLKEMYISAYQSFLWNECVKEFLRRNLTNKNLYQIEYCIGTLTYYKKISPGERKIIDTVFPTISQSMDITGERKAIIDKILQNQKLKLDEFDIKKETGNFFKTHDRKIIVIPSDFSISEPKVDKINKQRFYIQVEFKLEKGSYATIITKRLFNR